MNDGLDTYREEYNDMLMEKATGSNSIVQDKYLTVSVSKKNVEDARLYFSRVVISETIPPYGNYNYGIGNAEIIKVAASQIGNKGGRKFWTWYGLKSRVAWCTIFVSWCADQCGYVKAGIIPKYSNCRDTMRWFKAKHQYQSKAYTPQPGDIIWYDWNGDGKADHIGFVEKAEGGKIYTIEGNSGDMCRRRTRAANNSLIMGYGSICRYKVSQVK